MIKVIANLINLIIIITYNLYSLMHANTHKKEIIIDNFYLNSLMLIMHVYIILS
jgi:hypothetical protein